MFCETLDGYMMSYNRGWVPYSEPEIIQAVHALIKAAASKKKRSVGEDGSMTDDESEQPDGKKVK